MKPIVPFLLAVTIAGSGWRCGRDAVAGPTPAPAPAPVVGVDADALLASLEGRWSEQGTTFASVNGVCGLAGPEWSLHPAGNGTAAVTFSARCAGGTTGVKVDGRASVDNLVVHWAAAGTVNGCAVDVAGTAERLGEGLRLTFGGTACGMDLRGETRLIRGS